MGNQWLVIARREFFERIRSRWFIAITALGPLLMIGLIVVVGVVSVKAASQTVTIEVIDHGNRGLGDAVASGLQKASSRFAMTVVPADTSPEVLRQRIADEKIDGFLDLPADTLDGGTVTYVGSNATNMGLTQALRESVNGQVTKIRATEAGIPASQLSAILARIDFEATRPTGSSGGGSLAVGSAVVFVLYFAILFYAINLLRSVIEEKTNRVVEIVVSSTRATHIMLGKILGVGSVGLVQLAVWATMGIVLFQFHQPILEAFGIHMPPLSVPLPGPADLAILFCYFLLGYFLYAAMFAAIGAMVTSEQEAGQVQAPVVMMIVVPMIFMSQVAGDPRGGLAQVLTLIPFTSPILMPMRYLLGGASAVDVALSLGLLVATLAGIVWAAARIYRVGILMYGKRPSLVELLRWIRYA